MNAVRIIGSLLLAVSGLVAAAPAQAASRITVTNDQGVAVIDPTYATTLTVEASGFQSVRNGRGGVYVFFGTVGDGWRPSAGGQTGRDYLYVPDSEGRNNAGYQRFVAFPGSDTADSANGGTMTDAGSFSTTITVPGAVFDAVDRNNNVRSVDCRKVACGIITIGAHGVTSAPNETFTPLRVQSMYGEANPSPSAAPAPSAGASATAAPQVASVPTPAKATRARPATRPATGPIGKPALSIDLESARAGAVLSFTARGLSPGRQVSATLDDGAAAVGPLTVGSDGRLAGVISVPADIGPGTHRLRLVGARAPAVNFAVAGVVSARTAPVVSEEDATDRSAVLFVAGSAVVLVLALARLLLARRRSSRTAAGTGLARA